jgi:hypothetical protein
MLKAVLCLLHNDSELSVTCHLSHHLSCIVGRGVSRPNDVPVRPDKNQPRFVVLSPTIIGVTHNGEGYAFGLCRFFNGLDIPFFRAKGQQRKGCPQLRGEIPSTR